MTLRNAFEDLATETTVSALNTNILQLLTALHQEDSPHVSGHYGAALSLIMLLLIAATSVFNTDDKDNSMMSKFIEVHRQINLAKVA